MFAGIPAAHYAKKAKCAVCPAMGRSFSNSFRVNAWAVVGIPMRQHDGELGGGSVVKLVRKPERQLFFLGDTRGWLFSLLGQSLNFIGDSGGGNGRKQNRQRH